MNYRLFKDSEVNYILDHEEEILEGEITTLQLCEKFSRSIASINGKLRTLGILRGANRPKYYVIYRGDDVVASGSLSEVAKELNLAESTICHYGTPTHIKRSENSKTALRTISI